MWTMEEKPTIVPPLHIDPANRSSGVEQERREQIIAAAKDYFQYYGYEKTTVSDLAKAIGFSKAYIYKFFDSKQEIGEAVCGMCLSKIADAAQAIADEDRPALDKIRRIFKTIARQSGDLLFQDRKIHDLATTSLNENWGSTHRYSDRLLGILKSVLKEGREAGEFERKTPLDETARAILISLETVKHPAVLAHKLDTLDEDATLVADLVLRSLAP